jgi:hypothetical protein
MSHGKTQSSRRNGTAAVVESAALQRRLPRAEANQILKAGGPHLLVEVIPTRSEWRSDRADFALDVLEMVNLRLNRRSLVRFFRSACR